MCLGVFDTKGEGEQLLEWRLHVTNAISIMKRRDFKICEQRLHLLESRKLARSTFRQDPIPEIILHPAEVQGNSLMQ